MKVAERNVDPYLIISIETLFVIFQLLQQAKFDYYKTLN